MRDPSEDPFERTHAPLIGVPERLVPGVRVVTAPNPGPMTFTGTRTYIVGEGCVAVIDPGPDDPRHAGAVMDALAGERVAAILVTHAHRDHAGGAGRLAALTGAEVLAHGDPAEGARPAEARGSGGGAAMVPGFRPDRRLAEGDVVEGPGWRLAALHTPGHRGDHLCFAWSEAGVLFSGDTLMAWATTVIAPPEGNLGAFMASLDRLATRQEPLFLPGHGPPLRQPRAMIDWQRAHRRARTAQILEALGAGADHLDAIVTRVYAGLDPALRDAAARTVLAHLLALEAEGIVALGPGARPRVRLLRS